MKYLVKGSMTVSCWTVVEAGSKEEALEIADGREPAGLSHNALYPEDDESWHFENDGSPQNVEIES